MARLMSTFALEFDAYVKLLGGHMIYLHDHMEWVVTFPAPHGNVAQVRIPEGTPLDDAVAVLAESYKQVHGSTPGGGMFTVESENG